MAASIDWSIFCKASRSPGGYIMSTHSEEHATLVIERSLKVKPAAVYAAWSNAQQKRAWFACHDDWASEGYSLDFRVGGAEMSKVRGTDGTLHVYQARINDIVPNRRIVYSYDMLLGDRRISVSLATVAFASAAGGTRMVFTEQVVFLDGFQDGGGRRHGTEEQFVRLELLLHPAG